MLARDGSRRLKKFAEDNEKKEFRQITQGVWYVRGMGHSNAAFCRGQDGRDPHRHAGYIRAGAKTGRAHSKAAGKENENDPLYAQPIRPPGRRGDVCGNEPKVAALRAQKSLEVLLKSNAPVFSN